MLSIHDRAIVLNDLANSYALEMRYTKAIEKYREALALYISLAKDKPVDYSLHMAHVFSNLSIIYFNLKKFHDAEEFYKHALRLHRALGKHSFDKYGIGLACCIMEGVCYLKQHSLMLYESEAILNNFRGIPRAEGLLEGIVELRKKQTQSSKK